jgi:hypothetical protein|eukprot:g5044.t1
MSSRARSSAGGGGRAVQKPTSGRAGGGAIDDISLWLSHDNELRQEKASTGMPCLLETELGDKQSRGEKQTVLLLCTILSKGEHESHNITTGRFFIQFGQIFGFVYPDEHLETQVEKDMLQVRLRPSDSCFLIDALRGFQSCTGAVSIIFAPQNFHGEWYPRGKNEGGKMRNLPAMFRSNGVGYMKVGDDLNNNGTHFFSLGVDEYGLGEDDVFQSYFQHNPEILESMNPSKDGGVEKGAPPRAEGGYGEAPHEPIDLLSDEEIELFRKFVKHMEERGYFDGLEKGSQEYELRFDTLLSKFAARVESKRKK